jgi:hypothetical protein
MSRPAGAFQRSRRLCKKFKRSAKGIGAAMSESYPFTPRMVPPGEVVQIGRSFSNFGVKLVELQYLKSGFEVCEVRIDNNVFKNDEWIGKVVEKGSKLTTVFKNVTDETQSLQGVWYADLLEVAAPAASAPAVPAKGPAVSAEASSATEASSEEAPPQVEEHGVTAATHTEDFPKESVFIETPPEAPPPPQKRRARTGRDFTAAVTPGYNEVAICLTFDQLRRVHEVLNLASSSFMHHNEIPGIMRPFTAALESLRDD